MIRLARTASIAPAKLSECSNLAAIQEMQSKSWQTQTTGSWCREEATTSSPAR